MPDGLRALDPGLVLDLRSDWELKQPHPLDGSPAYRRIPWIDPDAEKLRDPDAEPRLLDVYRNSLTRNADHIRQVFAAIADAPADRPVVVHCKAGKDRTGLTVAVLLELAGVPRDRIVADYAISEASWPDTILGSLEHLDSLGGVRAYLSWLGLSAVQVHRLAARLVPVEVDAIVFDFEEFWPGHGGNVTEQRYAVLAAAVGGGFDRSASHARRLAHRDRLHAELDFRPGIREWIGTARLQRLGVPAAIAVEDTPHGVAAAQAAGMYAVAVPNPFVPTASVAAADLVLSSADDMLLTELLLSARPKGSTLVTD
ncbi:tyrosine-protein phosphatase [Kribbella sp. WER1]